jgi:hypothetical protein
MGCRQSKDEAEMPYRPPRLVHSRSVPGRLSDPLASTYITSLLEHLQDRLSIETSNPAFSELPFRYMEISKVLLDVYAKKLSSNSPH